MKNRFLGAYESLIFKKPLMTLLLVLVCVTASSYWISKFRMDASADALVLENDKDLRFFREVYKKYKAEDFLFVAYTPNNGDILSKDSLDDIQNIKTELLNAVPNLSTVFTVLDAPLIDSPRLSLSELQQGPRTVRTEGVDKNLARKELQNGIAYGNNLVSTDGKVTAMLLNFKRDEKYNRLLEARESIRQIKLQRELTPDEQAKLAAASAEYTAYQIEFNNGVKQDITRIRNVLNQHKDKAEIFLGGPSMIAVDMVNFIRKDLAIFGIGILLLLVGVLTIIFRRLRWVLLPMLSCVVTVVLTTSLLGLLDWPITVISSNYVSLLLIITLSMNIHLVVRYRHLHANVMPEATQLELVKHTMKEMAMPCFYMTITTMVAFGSLVVSGIRPVIDFGYMMVCGVLLAFVSSFVIFPLVLQLLKKHEPDNPHNASESMTIAIGQFTLKRGNLVLFLFGALAVITAFGITKLQVENRFIDYFKSDTEIHQGMLVIDQKLGGTTPLEVIIKPDAKFYELLEKQKNKSSQPDTPQVANTNADDEWGGEEDLFDEGEDLFGEDEDLFDGETTQKPFNYWFNSTEIKRLENIHDYIQAYPEVGKVMSFATATKMATMVNKDVPLNDFELSVLDEQMPDALRKTLVQPYLSEDYNEARIVMRVVDSNKELRRGELIERMHKGIIETFGFEPEQVRMTGMLVLYNNMLQSLFESQIMTLGAVMAVIFFMFIVLFRSIRVAAVAMLPNILSSTAILGVIGWLGIPLDLMTITIAAITVGIAVDDAIHYIYEFKQVLIETGDYAKATLRGHANVGKAMYYTSITIVVGFSILVFSNFIPSIYFGVLSGVAMLIALLCNLLLLPRLLVLFKPFGKHPKA